MPISMHAPTLLILVILASAATVRAEEPLFPFVLSYDSPANLTNMASWLNQPAGKHGFVREQDGRLATDAGPIRFWATNICFDANFGSHDMAERIAARLARLGINCVRLHHMDSKHIWGKSTNKLTIDPAQLERLDYLIAQLKQHGVYVNINLHVSRWLDAAEGFPGDPKDRPKFDKGLDNFEPRMIELQKKYARDLLTHVNPYTKTAYTDEPAIAFIEINNENAIFQEFGAGHLDDLPEPYATTYRSLWNQWLHKKYATNDTVPIVRRRGGSATKAAQADFIDFLWDLEHDYWTGMYQYLKDDLKVHSLVTGTQLGYSPASIQLAMDYLDDHAYWNHPSFPPGKSWDNKNWTVRNVALANSPKPESTLFLMAARRVAGRPYTVSEYNHPQPNQYAAEGFPMIAAFGALQGWDGIYSFAYCHNQKYETHAIENHFDIKADAAKLVHMPACVAMFVRGDVAAAKQLVTVPMSLASERAALREAQNARSLTTDAFGLDSRNAMIHRIGLELVPDNTPLPAVSRDALSVKRFVSDTGQLCWDISKAGAGYFTVNTPRTKLFTGFVAGRNFNLGNVELSIGKTRLDWATVSMVCVDGSGFDQPGRILIAATGVEQNTGADLKTVSGDKVTLGDQWGKEPLLCEGIPASITLPMPSGQFKCYVLDESGNRRAEVPVVDMNGQTVIALSPQYRTLWYEVEIEKSGQ